MLVLVREKPEVTLAFEGIEYRKAYLTQKSTDRLCTHPIRKVSKSKNLSFSMRVPVISRGMRVYNHHPVDIVDV